MSFAKLPVVEPTIMSPLRVLMLLPASASDLFEAVPGLEATGWAPTVLRVNPVINVRSVMGLVDTLSPNLVHLSGVRSVKMLLGLRARGLPVLVDRDSTRPDIFTRLCSTVQVPNRFLRTKPDQRLHYLYLAALNLAFGPPVVRDTTRAQLTAFLEACDE